MAMTAQQKKREIEDLFEKAKSGTLRPDLEDGDEVYPFPPDSTYPGCLEKHLSDPKGAPCYQWLGLDVTSDQHLTMEFNIVNSSVRFQLKYSMRKDDRRCVINLRPRSATHDGPVTSRDKAHFIEEIQRGFGAAADLKNVDSRNYFKPFGRATGVGTPQVDVLFDAIFVGSRSVVHPCPARPLGGRDSLQSAIHHVLDILNLCRCHQANTGS